MSVGPIGSPEIPSVRQPQETTPKPGSGQKSTAAGVAAARDAFESVAGHPTDIMTLVQQVMHEAFVQTQKDLEYMAQKLQGANETKAKLRQHMAGLRERMQPATEKTVALNADFESAISRLEEELQSVGDDAQLANIDLQNLLQKQQQTLQMMSNVSKMLHDTALAVIRKIG